MVERTDLSFSAAAAGASAGDGSENVTMWWCESRDLEADAT